MQTTVSLEDDAFEAVRSFELPVRIVNGFPIFDVPNDFPVVAIEQVWDLLEEQ